MSFPVFQKGRRCAVQITLKDCLKHYIIISPPKDGYDGFYLGQTETLQGWTRISEFETINGNVRSGINLTIGSCTNFLLDKGFIERNDIGPTCLRH